eukprot:jgi/Picre1/33711/NNA_001190.t1
MSLRTASQLWLSGPKTRLPYSVNPRRCSSLVVKGKGLDVADGEARVLTCVDVSSHGSGVCKDKETGLVVFVPDSLPGEILRARIEKSGKQSFAHGVKLETLKSHDGSRMAYCKHCNHDCGGCSLQNLTYSPHQLDLKQNSVFNAFKRIGGVKSLEEKGIFRDIVGCDDEFHYRNKVEFSVDSHAKVIGKHVRGSADALVHISECVLQTNAANQLYRDICAVVLEEDAVISTVQHIVIRFSNAFQQCLVNIVTKDDARNNLSRLVEYVSERHADTLRGIVNSVSQDGALLEERKVETEHVLWGEGDLLEKFHALLIGYLQTRFFKRTQSKRKGCTNARYNAALNGVDNVEFVQGDVGHISQLTHGRQPDIVVVDPARAGLSKRAIKGLLKCMPKKLVYVSCNAATQARDVREFLNNGYWLESVRPFDLFPQTMHVECVAVLHRKDA